MTALKRHAAAVALALAGGVAGFCGPELIGWVSNPHEQSLIREAEAIVGRPLTPVSVAGVARRTVRRCAVGVYNC